MTMHNGRCDYGGEMSKGSAFKQIMSLAGGCLILLCTQTMGRNPF